MRNSLKTALPLLLLICFMFTNIQANVTWDDVFAAYQKFNKSEKALGSAIGHLNSLDTKRTGIHVEWKVNREEIRDQSIELAATGTTMVAMGLLSPISPSGLASALSDAARLAGLSALDLSEQYTLDKLLGIAIGKVDTQLNKIGDDTKGLVKARNDAFVEYRRIYKEYYSHPANLMIHQRGRFRQLISIRFAVLAIPVVEIRLTRQRLQSLVIL